MIFGLSARFRVKKKHRTLDLERSVSDLTGRAEDLEREAADLRRENSWLKEIVMLKSSRLTSSSKAQRERAARDDDEGNADISESSEGGEDSTGK
jgi:hypothetical protein